jgi:hypothetical protein
MHALRSLKGVITNFITMLDFDNPPDPRFLRRFSAYTFEFP